MTAPILRRPPASPCVGVCVIDEARKLCMGCARTLDEIAVWGSAPEAMRRAVWAALPERAATLGLSARRLDWRGPEVLDAVAQRFEDAAGTLVAGVYGAVAEVSRSAGEALEITRDADSLTLRTPRAALRLLAAPYMTAFEIPRAGAAPLVALAVPLGRAGSLGPAVLTDLGPDTQALLARDAGGRRFDLGVGRRAARFTIRCDHALSTALLPHLGLPFPGGLDAIAPMILHAGPVRVVETPCLRAEVDVPIPAPGAVPPEGPHTHLLPDHLAQGFDTPPTVALPKGYALSALLYPAP